VRGSTRRKLLTQGGILLLLFTLSGLLNANIVLTADWAEGKDTPVRWAMAMELTGAYAFLLLLPAIVPMVRRFPVGRTNWYLRLPLHLGSSVVIGVCHTLLMWGSRSALFWILGWGEYDYGLMRYRFVMEYQKQLLSYCLVYAIVAVADYVRESRERQLRAAELRGQLTEARLAALKMQLNPHFLFNTLNMISSHLHADPDRADTMISRLSDFLRGTLRHSDRQEVPLEQELLLLRPYLELMLARFEDRLSVEVQIAPETSDALVPHMLLQPLVENALAHGIARRTDPGRVRIASQRAGDRLRLLVEDNGPGLGGGSPDAVEQGVGLKNTRQRLEALYGDDQQLRFEDAAGPDGGLRLTLELPWRCGEGS
jgi:signal transduction histidine kinase